MFFRVLHGCLRIDSWMRACVRVYVCVHVHIYMYRVCGQSQKCECAYVFTCVFHRCLIISNG